MPSATVAESNGTSPPSTPGKPLVKVLPRNVLKVILGDLEFETWYHSPYPDSLIFWTATPSLSHSINGLHHDGVSRGNISSSASWKSAVCPVLHVCPLCFAYSPSVGPYIAHLKHHHRLQKEDPEIPPVPESAEKVYEHAGYAVYKIDGEKEKLYCQNLSLFGKLFLEQKSVFFDTAGFWYNVLTYTPPTHASPPKKGRPPLKKTNCVPTNELGLSTRVLGFFSKEKLSWDQNNLACILIFPPFQHRQLGKLLMAVSYKLSGWEWMGEENCAIGGPEKPLSVMGRKSYLRFWSERIARYLMGQSGDSDGNRVFASDGNSLRVRKTQKLEREELSVKDIGERTGMLAEDVIAALTEMGVCETDGRRNKKSVERMNGTMSPQHDEASVTMVVKRSKVLDWANANGIQLEDPVKEEGFIGEWATIDEDDHQTARDDSIQP